MEQSWIFKLECLMLCLQVAEISTEEKVSKGFVVCAAMDGGMQFHCQSVPV